MQLTPRSTSILKLRLVLLPPLLLTLTTARLTLIESGDSSYIGCFSEPPTFWLSFPGDAGAHSRLGCSNACRKLGAPTFGLSNETCACGVDLPSDLQAVRNTSCGSPCPSFGADSCGRQSFIYASHWTNFTGKGPSAASSLASSSASSHIMSDDAASSKLWLLGAIVPVVVLVIGVVGAWWWYGKIRKLVEEVRSEREGFRSLRYEEAAERRRSYWWGWVTRDGGGGQWRRMGRFWRQSQDCGFRSGVVGQQRRDGNDESHAGVSDTTHYVPFFFSVEDRKFDNVSLPNSTRSSSSLPLSLGYSPNHLQPPPIRPPYPPKAKRTSLRSVAQASLSTGARVLSKKRRSTPTSTDQPLGEIERSLKPQRTRKLKKKYGTGENEDGADGSDTSDGMGMGGGAVRQWGQPMTGEAYYAMLAPNRSPTSSPEPIETQPARKVSFNDEVGGDKWYPKSGSSEGGTPLLQSAHSSPESKRGEARISVVTSASSASMYSLDSPSSPTSPTPTQLQPTFSIPESTSSSSTSLPSSNTYRPSPLSATPLALSPPVNAPQARLSPPRIPPTPTRAYSSADYYSDNENTVQINEPSPQRSDFEPSGVDSPAGTFGARAGKGRSGRDSSAERRPLFGPREMEKLEAKRDSLEVEENHPYAKGFKWLAGAMDSRGSLPSQLGMMKEGRLVVYYDDMIAALEALDFEEYSIVAEGHAAAHLAMYLAVNRPDKVNTPVPGTRRGIVGYEEGREMDNPPLPGTPPDTPKTSADWDSIRATTLQGLIERRREALLRARWHGEVYDDRVSELGEGLGGLGLGVDMDRGEEAGGGELGKKKEVVQRVEEGPAEGQPPPMEVLVTEVRRSESENNIRE
ncbi:hypothetical protein P7C70_g7155, partial [Phenoliferia sp. Uapishka_3]